VLKNQPQLALFLATSGHSGVDRVMQNLVAELARRELCIDLLRIRNHGPDFRDLPGNVRCVDLGTAHVNSSFGALRRYLKSERPEAILSDKDRLNRLLLFARRLAGVDTRVAVRLGTTVSENLARRSWFDRNLQYFSFRKLYPWADAILVPSQGAAQDFSNVSGMDIRRISVVPSPVVNTRLLELAAEPLQHDWYIDKQVPVVLGVGELCARKDFETLIRAFALLRGRLEARLLILGEGRQRQQLSELVVALGLAECVEMPGFVDNPYPFMAGSNVFALCSRCEGAPVVLMEALASGCPVVSTDCPSGPREILQGGKVGPLVPIGDVAGLAEAMEKLISHPPDRQRLRDAAAPFSAAGSADAYLKAMGFEPESQG
jgi:glycosyltransferase involved in cell wall biosynthesis